MIRVLLIKRGSGQSPIHEGFNGTFIYEWEIVHCHVWLPDGIHDNQLEYCVVKPIYIIYIYKHTSPTILAHDTYIHILYTHIIYIYTTHVWYYWGSIGMLPFFACDPPFSQVPSFHRLDAAGVRLGGLRCAGSAQRHGDAVPLGGAHGATGHPRSVHLVSVWPQGPMAGAADEMNIRIK